MFLRHQLFLCFFAHSLTSRQRTNQFLLWLLLQVHLLTQLLCATAHISFCPSVGQGNNRRTSSTTSARPRSVSCLVSLAPNRRVPNGSSRSSLLSALAGSRAARSQAMSPKWAYPPNDNADFRSPPQLTSLQSATLSPQSLRCCRAASTPSPANAQPLAAVLRATIAGGRSRWDCRG